MKDNGILIYSACPLCIVAICACLGFAAPQITVERGAPPRNITQGQNQQSLPPEKKKSLSKYGPEDAFPGAADQEANKRRGKRQNSPPAGAAGPVGPAGPSGVAAPRSRSSAKPSPTLLPTPSPTPSLTPEPTQPATPTPTPTALALPTTAAPIKGAAGAAGVAGAAQANSSAPSVESKMQPGVPQWLLPSLAILSLIVLCVLIYVLIKLYEKLRPGRPPYGN